MQTKIEKIYSLSTVGGAESISIVEQLNGVFDNLRKTKKALNAELQKAMVDKSASEQISKLNSAIKETDEKLQSLSKQRAQAERDSKAAIQNDKILADIKLKEAQATAAQARADKERMANIIQQDKELDRQIDQEEKRTKALEKQAKATQEATGYYNKLKAELKELYAATNASEKGGNVEFRGNTLAYDQAIIKLKELSAAEQAYRRQFTQDSLLVGEYTTGIVNAFKKVGLDDLITGQLTTAKTRLQDLNNEFNHLQQQYQKLKTEGVSSFGTIEKEMLQNRSETQRLETELKELSEKYHSVGSVGEQVAHGLEHGFAHVRSELTQFALGFFGIQQSLFALKELFEEANEEFTHLDLSTSKFHASLQNLGRTTELEDLEHSMHALAEQYKFLDHADLNDATDKLVVYGKLSKEQIEKLLPVIVDFASRQRITLSEATSVIVKGLEGQTRALKDYGINISDVGSDAGRFGEIMDQLGTKVKGSAEAFGTSAAGKMAIYREELREAQEELGEKFLPVQLELVHLTTNFATVIAKLIGFISEHKKAILGLVGLYLIYKEAQILSIANGLKEIAVKQLKKIVDLDNLRILNLSTAAEVENAIVTKQATALTALFALAQKVLAGEMKVATAWSILFNNTIKASPIGALLSLLGPVVLLLSSFTATTKSGTAAVKEQSEAMKANAEASKLMEEIRQEGAQKIGEEVAYIKSLTAQINDNTKSTKEKEKALRQLIALDPEFLKGLKLAKDGHLEGAEAINKYIDALNNKAIAEAALDKKKGLYTAVFDAKSQIQELEKATDAIYQNRKKVIEKANKQTADLGASRAHAVTDFYDKQISANDKKVEALQRKIDEANKSLGDIDEVIKGFGPDVFKVTFKRQDANDAEDLNKSKQTEKEKLDDELKRIQAGIDLKKSVLQTAYNEGKINEQDYYTELDKIVQKGESDKINTVDRYQKQYGDKLKKYSGELAKVIADAQLEQSTSTKETQEKLFKYAEDRINKDYELQKKLLDNNLKETQDSFFSSESEKLAAKVLYNEKLLALENTKYNSLLKLDKKFAEALQKQQKAVADGLAASNAHASPGNFLAAEDIKQQEKLNQAFIDLQIAIDKVYKNTNLSLDQQKVKIADITKEYEKQISKVKLDSFKTQVQPFLMLQAMGLPLPDKVKELLKKYWELVNAENAKAADEANNKAKGKFSLKNFFKSAFKLDFSNGGLNTEELKIRQMEKLYQEAGNTLKQFYSNYFALQEASIEKNKEEMLSHLEKEKERMLRTAQSSDEQETINKKIEKEEQRVEREASERKRKLQLQQATVSFAGGLIGAYASAAPLLANPITVGPALGTLLSTVALLTTQYVLNRSLINAQKFADGGQVVPALSSGLIDTPSNISSQPNGDNVLATVRTGEVILNEQQQQRAGGPDFFRRLGVPGFASGGKVGQGLDSLMNTGGAQPPAISVGADGRLLFGTDAIASSTNDIKEAVAEQGKQIQTLVQMIAATDKKEVFVYSGKVEAKNQEHKNSSEIGVF